jgi:hypothetical protein
MDRWFAGTMKGSNKALIGRRSNVGMLELEGETDVRR